MNSQTIYFIGIALLIISFIIQYRFRNKAKKFSQSSLSNGMSGAEIALKMLNDNGIYDVQVTHTPGSLTDHYNPATKTVNLSDEVYHGRSTLAAAVAAHECGHALQHADAYAWLEFRSMMAGPVTFASRYVMWVILAGFFAAPYLGTGLFMVGVVLFSLTTLFTVITLPVEFDASKRALAWLSNKQMLNQNESKEAKTALNWAASTYVIAALSSIATLLYYFSLLGDD